MNHMETNSIADRVAAEVKAAMKDEGISQREMARRTGIPLNTLSARLNPRSIRPFTMGELGLVLDTLNISLVELAVRAERKVPA